MPHDTDHKPARPLGLSPAQIAGSALSAVSAAFVASWAGTTGTLIGAAVGSVIATIGAALYTSSLRRSSEAVRRAAYQVRQTSRITSTLPRTSTDPRPQEGEVLPGTTPENVPETTSWRHRLPWGKVLLSSLAVMVAALGGITAVEAITGRPISSYLGHDSSPGTTVGHVIGSDSSTPKNTGTDKTDKSGPQRNDATTPSQDAQPSTPADPQPPVQPVQPVQPSEAPPAPVLPPDPEPSTAP